MTTLDNSLSRERSLLRMRACWPRIAGTGRAPDFVRRRADRGCIQDCARPFRTGPIQKLSRQPKRDFKMRSFLSGYLIVELPSVGYLLYLRVPQERGVAL